MGDITPLFCNYTDPKSTLVTLLADCGIVNQNDAPEIACDCCTACCNDVTGCENDKGLAECQRDLNIFNSKYPGRCECIGSSYPVGGIVNSLLKGDLALVEDTDATEGVPMLPNNDADRGSYALSCHSTYLCKICGENENDPCVFRWDGYTFDGSGDSDLFVSYEYAPGSIYEGTVVTIVHHSGGCDVSIDGMVCSHCIPLVCDDLYDTIRVSCGNLPLKPSFNGCSFDLQRDFLSAGALQVLHESYNYDPSRHSSDTCENVNHPAHCNRIVPFAEDSDGVSTSCDCDDSGLELTCLYDECTFCLESNHVDDNKDPHPLCFHYRKSRFFDEGNLLFNDSFKFDFFVLSNDRHKEGAREIETILSFTHSASDGSCNVTIDGEECTSCNNMTTCPENENFVNSSYSWNYLINCENVLGEDAIYHDECIPEPERKAAVGGGGDILRVLSLIKNDFPECIRYANGTIDISLFDLS